MLQNILVAHKDGQTIQEYTPSGILVRNISDSNGLFHAVERKDGTLAVSRQGPVHGVCVMSVDGQILGSYGNSTMGAGPGQMNTPSSLAVNKDGFVIVADSANNRILVLDPTLTEARPLLINITIFTPVGLSLDESVGRLYVGELYGSFRVLVIDNVFDLGAALFQQ
jgi:DNA-binding beta-propeller fold protein YncE